MTTFISIVIALAAIGGIAFYQNHKKVILYLSSLGKHFSVTNDQMVETMAIGIYHRFKADAEHSDETPYDFERFVAAIVEKVHGGMAGVTLASGDFGVDIEHRRENGLHLGQVKCYLQPVGYEPIAIIHSQMVKQGAVGGFVVTTSTFTQNARDYARGLGIELIDGVDLVRMWIQSQDVAWKQIEKYQV